MEKKKIIARKIATADEQEKALQALLRGEQTISSPTPLQEAEDAQEASVPKKTKGAKPKAEVTKPAKQSHIVRRKIRDIQKPQVELQRITIDLPADLYDMLKRETDETGTTFRWQIINLLRNHFKNR